MVNQPDEPPPPLTPGQKLGRLRWKGKTAAEKRAHAMKMVRARRKKLRARSRKRSAA